MIYRKLTTKEIFHRNQERSSPLSESFIIWLHNIRSMHNVGAVFRNSDAFGVHELWLSGYTPVPPRPEISKTALGAEEHEIGRASCRERVQITGTDVCMSQHRMNKVET